MKPENDRARGDHLLRRHDGLPSQFDSPLPSAASDSTAAPSRDSSPVQLDLRATLPVCPLCHDALFVRLERVLSGRRVSSAYYCGRCTHEWQVEATPPVEIVERRIMDRRRRPRLHR